jgi:predicted nucleic acid-binding protein
MAAKVLDAYAMMAFLEDEPGANQVRELILRAEDRKVKLLMSVVNLGEVWYSIAKTSTASKADEFIREIQGMAIEIVNIDWGITRIAAEFKSKGKISYADCYAAALSKARRAELITGDKELKSLEGEINIKWLN